MGARSVPENRDVEDVSEQGVTIGSSGESVLSGHAGVGEGVEERFEHYANSATKAIPWGAAMKHVVDPLCGSSRRPIAAVIRVTRTRDRFALKEG